MRAPRLRRGAIVGGVALLALLLGAAPLPATAAAGTTISGRVVDAGHAVADVRVGYSVPGTKITVRSRTSASGRFTLHVPADAGRGFVWAGRDVRDLRVVFVAHGVAYVRSVIGRTGSQGVLFQTRRAAAPDDIDGGRVVTLHLHRAAHLAGHDASLARFEISLRRDDGSLVQSVLADAHGGYRSTALAAGRYALHLRPPGSAEATSSRTVTLHAGRITAVPAGAARRVRRAESLVTGTVTAPSDVASVAVRVEVLRGDRSVAVVRADAHGRYRIRGLATGRYTLVAGRNAPDDDNDSPSTPPTPDDVVEGSGTVAAHAGRASRVDLRLGDAGHIAGTTSGRRLVLVEDPTGALVRVARSADDGGFEAGGLPTGDYSVTAVGDSSSASVDAHVVAGTTTDVGAIRPSHPLLALTGTIPVSGLTAGEVLDVSTELVGVIGGYDLVNASDGGVGTVSPDGRFTVSSLVPGLHRIVASSYLSTGRTASSRTYSDGSPVLLDVTAASASPITLTLGARNAIFAGAFRSRGGAGSGYFPASAVGTALRGTSGNPQRGTFDTVVIPGTYTWPRSADGTAPAADGPWWARPVASTVTIPAGVMRDAVVRLEYHG